MGGGGDALVQKKTHDLKKTLSAHTKQVTSLLSLRIENIDYFISASADKSIIVWNEYFQIFNELKSYHSGKINSLALLNDNKMASSSMDTNIIIWKTSTDLIMKYELDRHLRQVECLAILSDGNLASGSDDFTVKIWNSIVIFA